MKLTSMQFDGDGGYDTPMNAGATANSAVQTNDDGPARRAAAAGRAEKMDQIAKVMTPAPGIPGDDAHKGMMARSNAMSPMTPSPSKVAPKATKAVDKSGYDRSIKVSQSTVDSVKRAGAYGSQKNAKEGMPGYYGSSLDPKAPASAEYKEAVKRVYPNAAKEPKAETPKAAPKNYGGAAADKYKAEEKAAKNKAAFPPILPKPGTTGVLPTPPAATSAKIKVSQDTVDAVKSAGAGNMGAKPAGATNFKGVTPEYTEAVKRVYPNAYASARGPAKPASAGPAKPKVYGGAAAEKYKAEKAGPAKIKVSQATVDAVKKDGKKTAQSNAKTNVTNAEYKEAVKRVYPSSAKPKAKSGGGGGGKASARVK